MNNPPQGTGPTGAVQTVPKNNEVQFIPLGGQDPIKLSVQIIRDFVAIPTKTGKLPESGECMRFMMLARSRRLNPFEGDCFLMGYEGREGVTWSLITAHQAFLKRAEVNPEFNGMESGTIVKNGDGNIIDREGDFLFEDDFLLGAWAIVHFKNRVHPIKRRLNLRTFRKPFGRWNDDPAGMIVKCAEADALRSAFPTMLGGLYADVERGPIIDVGSTAKMPDFGPEPGKGPEPAKVAQLPQTTAAKPAGAPEGSTDKGSPANAAHAPAGEPQQGTDEPVPEDFKPKQGENEACTTVRLNMHKAGVTEKQVMTWAKANGMTENATKLAELSEAKHKILVKSFANILPQLRQLPV